MKVFQLVNDPWKMPNPYVSSLMEGISEEHYDIEWGYGIDNFWLDSIYNYEIIHIHWPNLILQSHLAKIGSIADRLDELKSRGGKIVVTCHNFEPHYTTDNNKILAYQIVYSHADSIIHLGNYSKSIMEEMYPNAAHVVICHHTYDKLYHTISKDECIKKLGLDPLKRYILCFGAFRDNEERRLIDDVLNSFKGKGVVILAPNYYVIKKRRNFINMLRQWIKCRVKTIKNSGLIINGWYVSNDDLPYYYGASDISLLQRKKILNSGNLPMGFLMGNVVVGPNIGNVGEILKITGNPVFDVNNLDSINKAIENAFTLAENGKGEYNSNFAKEHFSTSIISNQIYDYYESIIAKK